MEKQFSLNKRSCSSKMLIRKDIERKKNDIQETPEKSFIKLNVGMDMNKDSKMRKRVISPRKKFGKLNIWGTDDENTTSESYDPISPRYINLKVTERGYINKRIRITEFRKKSQELFIQKYVRKIIKKGSKDFSEFYVLANLIKGKSRSDVYFFEDIENRYIVITMDYLKKLLEKEISLQTKYSNKKNIYYVKKFLKKLYDVGIVSSNIIDHFGVRECLKDNFENENDNINEIVVSKYSNKTFNLDYETTDPIVFSKQLTLHFHKLIKQLTIVDIMSFSGKLTERANIYAQNCNNLGLLIKSLMYNITIRNIDDKVSMKLGNEFLISILENLLNLNNYDCILTIVSSMEAFMYKCNDTIYKMSHSHFAFFVEMTELTSPMNNFRNYRSVYRSYNKYMFSNPPIVPIVPVIAKDFEYLSQNINICELMNDEKKKELMKLFDSSIDNYFELLEKDYKIDSDIQFLEDLENYHLYDEKVISNINKLFVVEHLIKKKERKNSISRSISRTFKSSKSFRKSSRLQ